METYQKRKSKFSPLTSAKGPSAEGGQRSSGMRKEKIDVSKTQKIAPPLHAHKKKGKESKV